MMRTYDPAKIIVTFKGIQIIGFHSGTFVKCERDEDTWSTDRGAMGDTVRVRSRKKGGKCTIVLQAASPTNDLLSAVAIQDELLGTGIGALQVKDLNGTTIWSAASAWIMKPPSTEFADDHSPREWVIDVDKFEYFVGGSLT